MSKLDLVDIEVCLFFAPEHAVDSAAKHDLHHVLPGISFIKNGEVYLLSICGRQMCIV
jgi:hypothetical protein